MKHDKISRRIKSRAETIADILAALIETTALLLVILTGAALAHRAWIAYLAKTGQ